ncbi:RDD family protein, partial [Cellulomonas sp. GbtcB1]|uniref:RDD family protein n=1 Tax=Cellulomonas sp. GbtcB1 TaxID=2824746 RepID=UPI001C2F452E
MSSTTGGVVPPSAPPAPVGRRVAAYLVDAALTSIAAAPLWLAWAPAFAATVRAASDPGAGTVPEPAAPSGVLLAVGAVLLAAWAVAQWVWNGTRGWTVGRRLLGLRLVDVRSGRPVGLGRAFVRALIVALGSLACGVGQIVVLLSPLFDSSGRRRGWHDRVGEGVVVDVRGLVPARRVADWPARADRAGGPGAPALPAPPAEHGGDAPAWPSVPHPAAPGDAWAGEPTAAGATPTVDPTPSEPTRTRWSALAADRRLDAPGFVLPPLGGPGLGPDLDTRQIPVVPAAVVPAHPAAPVPLAPGPDAAAPASGPAAPAPAPPDVPAPSAPGAAPGYVAAPAAPAATSASLSAPAVPADPSAPAAPPDPNHIWGPYFAGAGARQVPIGDGTDG